MARILGPVFVGIFLLSVFVIAHPDPEALHQAEYPAPVARPFVKPILTEPLIKPYDMAIITEPLMYPFPECPAADRGFNPLYAAAAHRHSTANPLHFGCLIHAVAERESRQTPDAKSHAGALGMMQITPPTARELNVDPLVPEEAVDGAARYLVWLSKRFPHVAAEDLPRFETASYNWGVGNVRRTGCTTWECLEPLLPRETRIYVHGVEQMQTDGTWYKERG